MEILDTKGSYSLGRFTMYKTDKSREVTRFVECQQMAIYHEGSMITCSDDNIVQFLDQWWNLAESDTENYIAQQINSLWMLRGLRPDVPKCFYSDDMPMHFSEVFATIEGKSEYNLHEIYFEAVTDDGDKIEYKRVFLRETPIATFKNFIEELNNA